MALLICSQLLNFTQMYFLLIRPFLLIMSFSFVVNLSIGDLLSQSGILFGIFTPRIVIKSDSSFLLCLARLRKLALLAGGAHSAYSNMVTNENNARMIEKFIFEYEFNLILVLNMVFNIIWWLYTWIAKNRMDSCQTQQSTHVS